MGFTVHFGIYSKKTQIHQYVLKMHVFYDSLGKM